MALILLICPFMSLPQPHSQQATGPHIQVSLVHEYEGLIAGQANSIGILLEPEELWHTYWRNPGDSGEAPKVTWTSDSAAEFGAIQWTLPKAIPVAHLVNYGYEGANLLMVDVFLPENLSAKRVAITADLSWLVCKDDCIPGWATLSIELPVTQNRVVTHWQALFQQTRDNLPKWLTESATFEITDEHIVIALPMELVESFDISSLQLLPFRNDVIQHSSTQTKVAADDTLLVTVKRSEYFPASLDATNWLVTDGQNAVYVQSQINSSGSNAQAELSGSAIAKFIALAFLGGLMLNLMPCVLPVISLKALSLRHTASAPGRLGYPLGVMVSFWLFALTIILLRATGESIGWGFHMQEPWLIALLAFLFVFIAMLLLDLAPAGVGLANAGQQLTQGNQFHHQFFTGVLAVVVASPCTAPFMAAAMGIAFISSDWITMLIFTGLALGFALPLSLISYVPAMTRWIPKPGNWMVRFRQFLVFPVLATVIWLVWIYQSQTSTLAQFYLSIALLLFALCLWSYAILKHQYRNIFMVIAGVIVYVAIQSPSSDEGELPIATPFSADKLAQLRDNGKTVLVNMTADWCITCKVNEQVAFQDERVKRLLASENVSYLVGDWTNKNDQILNYLQQFNRSGVPLYVIYKGEGEGVVLPQILTPEIVINAVNR
ncbi:MAG: protein-disulfide reductase DsbD family protein [Aestuariibacter sp.]